MAIFAGSRYEGMSYTVTSSDGGRTLKNFMHLRVPLELPTSLTITVEDKQELDLLAFRYSHRARNWWAIAEANALEWALDVPTGTTLDLPF
jgi:hypothetical protein